MRPSSPGLWRDKKPLLLASTSMTRRLILEDAGLKVETEAPRVDERAVEAKVKLSGGTDPRGLAQTLAAEKAFAVSRRRPDRVVVGADQVLDFGGDVLHKPADLDAARAQVRRLAGRTHVLHSAAAIARNGAVLQTMVDSARLTMRPLGSEAIDAYVALAGEDRVTASVGAYQIESLGVHLFDRVDGNHATILGLPLLALLAALRGQGLLAF